MIKNFENFVNESQMKVKRDDAEATNVLKRIARGQFYKYLNEDEELKELHKKYISKSELKDYLGTLGLYDKNYYRALLNRLDNTTQYTFEEFKKISEILLNIGLKDDRDRLIFSLKNLLEPIKGDDFERDYEYKLKFLKSFPKFNKNLPIVIAINGKTITGEVYYNEFLNIYTETEDEMRKAIDNFISSSFYKCIEMIDDYNIDDFSQVKNYSKVNLEE
jgi:hypothetical protein